MLSQQHSFYFSAVSCPITLKITLVNLAHSLLDNMTTDTHKSRTQITLRNSPLTVAQKHKHLGIIFQHDLRWTEHIEYIVNKSLKSFNILFRLRSTLTSDSLSHIYQTFILPIFSYASNALTPLSHTSLDRIERLQRKAARICLHLPLYTHLEHSHLLHRIKWPTLFSRFKVKHILFAHSLRYNYAPPHILSLHTASNV